MALLSRCCAVAAVCVTLAAGRSASADPYQLGGFFGPRFFSDDAAIGSLPTFRTTLQSTVELGARLARPIYPWIIPELELPFASTSTKDLDVGVVWLEPRAQLRLLWPHGKVRPFAVLGSGAPITLSQHRKIYGSDISWDGYGGIGALFAPGRGLSFRADVRVAIVDGYEAPIAVEVEAHLGLYFELEHGHPVKHREEVVVGKPGDQDGDHIADDQDQCATRAEDEDGYQDDDGCPDIDNDLDHVLDIADACPSVAESYNGFEDEDGCGDSVPGDVDAIRGTVAGLTFDAGEAGVASSAKEPLDKIAEVMNKYPSVRVLLIGYTDDQEAKIDPIEGEDADATAQRLSEALVELSKQRAAAAADVLAEHGLARTRIEVDGKGAADPLFDNDSPRHRLRNRRVELQVYVPMNEMPQR